jgi:hypothetical protein
MTNPTSNFNWIMPEPTNLVTDLPADFEVFGQAVDTDLADLLGGTTGQVLSKTDPTGPVPTVTNSMATAIDAGDLIAGTAGTFPLGVDVTIKFYRQTHSSNRYEMGCSISGDTLHSTLLLRSTGQLHYVYYHRQLH